MGRIYTVPGEPNRPPTAAILQNAVDITPMFKSAQWTLSYPKEHTMTDQTPRPVTDADMEAMGPDFRVDGIPCVFLGEDAEWALGLGHIRQDRFLDALAGWCEENDPGVSYEFDEDQVVHAYAVASEWPTDGTDDNGPYFRWVSQDTPGAFPVTYLDMEA